MIRVGIVGISGYSGLTALKLLLGHPQVRLTYVSAHSTVGPLAEIWPELQGRTRLVCEKFDARRAAASCDLVFLAVPHAVSMSIVPGLLAEGLRVIDLSGDYRLKTAADYKKWYGKDHTDSRRLSKAVYGLPEIYKAKICSAKLIANPGCYPTAAILALAPLAALKGHIFDTVIIDAKSGVTGAGKKVVDTLMFPEVNESLRAYKLFQHQHTPEIERYAASIAGRALSVTFTPHLVPLNVGIFETIYVPILSLEGIGDLHVLYRKFYKTEPFVRVLRPGVLPDIKHVRGTNFCDIGLALDRRKKLLIITAAIDNLMKGAAGQAVQNMNLMCGFEEILGLL